MNTPAQQDKQAPTAATNSNAGRTRSLIAIAAACVVGGAAYAAWWMNSGRYFQDTDDAYVAGNVVQITAQVAGTVVGIQADDTQQVKAGQALIQLDGSDARVALDQAEAQLAQAVREVRALYASGSALEAAQRQKETDLARARDDLARGEAREATVGRVEVFQRQFTGGAGMPEQQPGTERDQCRHRITDRAAVGDVAAQRAGVADRARTEAAVKLGGFRVIAGQRPKSVVE